MKMTTIVFIQNVNEVDELEKIFKNEGVESLFDYLKEWDNDDNDGEIVNGVGKTDNVYENENYLMAYNFSIGYCALYKKN